jgi:hypothetical protein
MNREEMLREARTIEAMKNGYMGMEGKFAIIAKWMGNEIIKHGNMNFDQSFLSDPYEDFDENSMPTMSEDDNSFPIGLHYDGLSQGVNLSIYIYFYNREIICQYEGNTVYRESSGELEGYAPNQAWEKNINLIYKTAKEIERARKPVEKQKLMQEANKKRQEIFEEYKKKWGLS